MATMPVYNMTDLWNSGGTTYDAIKMNVTDSASAAASRLMTLQVGSVDKSYITKAGLGYFAGGLLLAAATALTFGSSDVAVTHSTDLLAFSGAASGYTFDTKVTVGHTANLSIGGNADNFEVFGTTAATGGLAIGMFNATAGTGPHLDFYRSKNASIGSATVVASGDVLGSVNAYGAQQTGTFATQTMAAQVRYEVDGTVTSGGSGDMPGRIVWATAADGGASVTDRMTLDSSGRLTVNTGVTAGAASAGAGSDISMNNTVAGQLVLRGNAYDFGIALNASGADIYTNSSIRPVRIGVDETVVATFTTTGLNSTVIGATTSAAGTFTTLTTTGAFTSLGIDDNATGERLQIADTLMNVGPSSTADYPIGRVLDTGSLTIGGSATPATTGGARMTLWGASHASQAGDFEITTHGAGGSPGIALDISATLLTLGAGGGTIYMPDTVRQGQNTTSVPGNGNNTAGVAIYSNTIYASASALPLVLNVTSDGNLVRYNSGGTQQGVTSVSGATVTYGTFFGSHWSQLADGSRVDIRRGAIIESISQLCNWPKDNEVGQCNEHLPRFKVSDRAGSKAVYGVWAWWDSDKESGTNDGFIGGLGADRVLIDAGETVEIGDLIESAGNGCGRVIRDRSLSAIEVIQRMVAKVTSTEVIESFSDGAYTVPATIHCG